jgi:hypothetical protein
MLAIAIEVSGIRQKALWSDHYTIRQFLFIREIERTGGATLRDCIPFVTEDDGNAVVRKRDQPVRNDVQPHHPRNSQIAIAVGPEIRRT